MTLGPFAARYRDLITIMKDLSCTAVFVNDEQGVDLSLGEDGDPGNNDFTNTLLPLRLESLDQSGSNTIVGARGNTWPDGPGVDPECGTDISSGGTGITVEYGDPVAGDICTF